MKLQKVFEICTICAVVFLMITFLVIAITPKYSFTETTYVVRSGDCLWTIAEKYCPNSMNTWDYIHRISVWFTLTLTANSLRLALKM